MYSRRQTLKTMLFGAAAGATSASLPTEGVAAEAGAKDCASSWSSLQWTRGIENQRKADRGDQTFLNPVMSGDHADPSILRDGDDYYMTFSSFDAYPGIVIWHSRDLINWRPVTAALRTPIGSVWAPELIKHGSRFYVYIPARTPTYRSTYVIHADDIAGPWSEPIDLKLPDHIDPGHAVGEDGKRYLFLSSGDRVRLTDDGLATVGAVEHVYDPWRYPDDWDVESFSPEGPKITRRGEWFYLITAVGGTAGPPTGHMVIAARSKSIQGPWEDAPGNPLVRTQSANEKWWSRGHATLVEGPDGSWWMMYHGYENGFWTLGRQTLLDPIEWTADGWFKATGGDLSRPIRKPGRSRPQTHGLALSDDFTKNKFGIQWGFYDPGAQEMDRVSIADGMLKLRAKGTEPHDCSPICFIAGDQSYRVQVDLEVDDTARAGLLLFYNRRLYVGLGFDDERFVMHRYGLERRGAKPAGIGRRLHMRITNDRHIVTIHHSVDGKAWTKYGVQMEVSGYHHNVAGDFLSLRPAIYAAGKGEVAVRNVRYEAL
ncbi:beta-xylosidase [Povalibacter uvarum]|uniref:Beta-xylosidase n=1 Tax=Povalibacter uvarum TaxID=732238 RepID=A0A841HJC0_9GAMM|nr:family 43 glycosylhydrolase [Povalibacter uvarum]MBB6092125.1 beta-xylosidase [Povalibacter uvarum]